jgi:hypothetical protein
MIGAGITEESGSELDGGDGAMNQIKPDQIARSIIAGQRSVASIAFIIPARR